MYDLETLTSSATSRRGFLTAMTAAGLGLAATKLLADAPGGVFAQAKAGDPDINFKDVQAAMPGIPGGTINELVLNFALTLEILEADLYRQALNLASGKSITAPLSTDSTTYSRNVGQGGLGTDLANAGFLYLLQFAYVEAAHRDFLTAAITASGGTPTTANSAGYAFPNANGGNMKELLEQIYPLEETGVRAYLGAAPYITDLGLATTAVGIYSTEARHSAAIAYILGKDIGPVRMPGDLSVSPRQPTDNTFEFALAPATVLSVASSTYFK